MKDIRFLDKMISPVKGQKVVRLLFNNIKGLGLKDSKKACQFLGFQETCCIEDLSNDDIELLRSYVENNYIINKNHDSKVSENIGRLIISKNYRGRRQVLGYPVRGQRTRSNARSQRRLGRTRLPKKLSEGRHVRFATKYLKAVVNTKKIKEDKKKFNPYAFKRKKKKKYQPFFLSKNNRRKYVKKKYVTKHKKRW